MQYVNDLRGAVLKMSPLEPWMNGEMGTRLDSPHSTLYGNFNKADLDARQNLYLQLAGIPWSAELVAAILE
jgi:hypothetical protein